MSFQTLTDNFALILFVLMVITGVIWLFDLLVLSRRRRACADKALEALDAEKGVGQDAREILEANILRQPTWVEYSGSFFPVIALVFVLRSFLFEPFKIPSESMLPTLYVGDLIL
ncbi:MAG: S26 family signal peptidase, partial [Undibacterium sp.]|nr:S26 family signal peptidase [Undibacterium sp.]